MRASPIRNSRGDSGVMHYAVVRDAALGWHREMRWAGIGKDAVSSQAREDMPPAIETAAPQEARRS